MYPRSDKVLASDMLRVHLGGNIYNKLTMPTSPLEAFSRVFAQSFKDSGSCCAPSGNDDVRFLENIAFIVVGI